MSRTKQSSKLLEKFLAKEVSFVEKKLKLPANLLSFIMEGKRIRAKLIERSLKRTIELTHASSLLHDDIVDESDLRRGIPTAFFLLPVAGACSIGYFLFSRLFLGIIRRKPFVYQNYFRTLEEMCLGQIMEIENAYKIPFSIRKYRQTIRLKTGSLFAFCLGINKNKWNQTDANMGYKFGIAFQILDDLYDVTLDEIISGKPTKLDAKRGIITLPYHLLSKQKQKQMATKKIEEIKSEALSLLQYNENKRIKKDWKDQFDEMKKKINSVSGNIFP